MAGFFDAAEDGSSGGADPFAYTGGSLLTPWSGKFEWGGGGVSAPKHTPFKFGKFSYNAPSVGRITARQLEERPDFAFDFKQDPMAQQAYDYRLKESQRALENSAAARGSYFSPNTMQALQSNAQGMAAQEYQAAYDRSRDTYGLNLDKEFGTFDRNWGAELAAGQANINAALGEGQLGYQIASGTYDRNLNLARTQWQDQANAAAASASASNANYGRALNEYQMGRDEFFQNQDRQYSKLMGMAGLGQFGAANAGAYGSQYAGNMGSIYGAGANAQAAGTMGGANAWGGALGSMGNAGMNLAAWNYMNPRSGG